MASSVKKAAHDIETRKRTDDVLLSEGIDFGSLLLSPAVLEGLSAAGFRKPSPIQLKAIPLGRCGLDLIVQAKSGTGKTCVFCTIALDTLVPENPATQVLVLAPTREIAVQIHSVVMAVGCAMEGLQCHVFIGGRPVSQDKTHLKKCHIAVGSPGRIKQLIELGMLSTASIRLFVLDEADKLLEEGSFQEQINWIFSSLPVNKQMLALSATYPESLAQHLTRYMREPTFVRLNPGDLGLKGLKQYYKLVQSHPLPHKVFQEKVKHLMELFSKIPFNQALVFSNLHTRAQHLADILSSKGLPAVCISGGLTQDQRLEAMSKLKQYQCRVLISTDLTSRGIDAEKVNLVINLDIPQDWETYMHRIGRAGRFGTQGLAVTYCCHGEEENKMMAIAQKCGLTLSVLPSTIETGLMDEPCDWDVCTEASTPVSLSQHVSKTEKKKRVKADVPAAAAAAVPSIADQPVERSAPTMPERSQPPPRRGIRGEATMRKVSPVSSFREVQTRKQQQDALPKIPPLSSFKSSRSSFMTFEEAEQDFWSFINTGLGRSVEVIRDFRGRDVDGDQNGHRESFMLHDDGTQSVTQKTESCKSNVSRPRSISSSSSSDTEENQKDDERVGRLNPTGGGEHRAVTQPHADAGNTPTVAKPKPRPIVYTTAPKPYQQRTLESNEKPLLESAPRVRSNREDSQAARSQTDRHASRKVKEEVDKRSKKLSEKMKRKRERYEVDQEEEEEEEGDDEDEEEEESSSEVYWRTCYKAWNDYYTSMTPTQALGYQSYCNAANSRMLADRMNAVYMEELLKK
ncbi:probable ATP-dependent RNA helicase DDX20 [Limanda limanda]|uniref:probable ATP-dependent RNA helicase DDX20 n=1 Tax=Limanda limanda TaxID=27771 RepID=UPI0029C89522|nr:probable ATP-dependent RNA helicase DDX20 [Limanda limanda]